jgi:periplasmic protein TonB
MSRNLLIAVLVSLLLHAGVAVSGYLIPDAPEPAPIEEEMPTIALDLPPPPEPDEPDPVDDLVASDAPATELADLAPPMQADLPSAVIDSAFVQPIQAPPPPGLNRPTGSIVIPTGPPRPAASGGLTNIFNLADLDQRPEPRVRINPVYPFEMRRSGLRGEVLVEFIVDTQGNVRDPFVVRSSHPGFEQAALDAVLKWKFRPGRKGGAPQNTRVRQPLSFNLSAD